VFKKQAEAYVGTFRRPAGEKYIIQMKLKCMPGNMFTRSTVILGSVYRLKVIQVLISSASISICKRSVDICTVLDKVSKNSTRVKIEVVAQQST